MRGNASTCQCTLESSASAGAVNQAFQETLPSVGVHARDAGERRRRAARATRMRRSRGRAALRATGRAARSPTGRRPGRRRARRRSATRLPGAELGAHRTARLEAAKARGNERWHERRRRQLRVRVVERCARAGSVVDRAQQRSTPLARCADARRAHDSHSRSTSARPSSANAVVCAGVWITTSFAPSGGSSAGYRFGTTRRAQP